MQKMLLIYNLLQIIFSPILILFILVRFFLKKESSVSVREKFGLIKVVSAALVVVGCIIIRIAAG